MLSGSFSGSGVPLSPLFLQEHTENANKTLNKTLNDLINFFISHPRAIKRYALEVHYPCGKRAADTLIVETKFHVLYIAVLPRLGIKVAPDYTVKAFIKRAFALFNDRAAAFVLDAKSERQRVVAAVIEVYSQLGKRLIDGF